MSGVLIAIVLLLAPIGILLSSSVFVAVFTSFLNRDNDLQNMGTEEYAVAYPKEL